MNTYKIYLGTNDKDEHKKIKSNATIEKIIDTLALDKFDGYTLTDAVGHYKKEREKTYVIEIITDDEKSVKALAEALKVALNQQEILTTKTLMETI